MAHYFYDTIYQLRSAEEIILYNRLVDFKLDENDVVVEFLRGEYENEMINFPFSPPEFNGAAALWGAKTVYTAAQILLYREHSEEELIGLFPEFSEQITPDAILSVDLCLRFLPQILNDTKNIDANDKLIPILEKILKTWHFSGIGISAPNNDLDFELIFSNECLTQLYLDRVIESKDLERAKQPNLKEKIRAILGNYPEYYWKELINLL
jgi:hypothetical protein